MTGRPLPPSVFSGDTGAPDPALAGALAAFAADETPERSAQVYAALLSCRLVVGVEAVLVEADASGADKESEMALATLVGRDGRHALPAFTGTEALARWRADARPVPVPALQAIGWALEQGFPAMVVDAAGPVPFVVEGAALRDLAAGYVPVSGAASVGAASQVDLVLRAPERVLPGEAMAGLANLVTAVGVRGAWLVELADDAGDASRDAGLWQLALAVEVGDESVGGESVLGHLAELIAAEVAEPLVLLQVVGDLAAQCRPRGCAVDRAWRTAGLTGPHCRRPPWYAEP